jgi:hypothetical protein
MAALGELLFQTLAAKGDDVPTVDAIATEFRVRVRGAGDLVHALEDTYTLLWQYYQETLRLKGSLELAQKSEANLHRTIQEFWSVLENTKTDKGALTHRLDTMSERAQSAEASLEHMKHAVLEARQQRDSLLSSTSWRVTAPLRALSRLIRR